MGICQSPCSQFVHLNDILTLIEDEHMPVLSSMILSQQSSFNDRTEDPIYFLFSPQVPLLGWMAQISVTATG